MKIVIKGKPYPIKTVEEVDLLDLLDLAAETKEMGRELNMAAIEDMETAVKKITHKDPATQRHMRGRHPDAIWLMGLTVWASRHCAGDDVTFRDAIRVSQAQITYEAEPGDKDVPDDPRIARPASGRAAKAAPKRPTRKTSARR